MLCMPYVVFWCVQGVHKQCFCKLFAVMHTPHSHLLSSTGGAFSMLFNIFNTISFYLVKFEEQNASKRLRIIAPHPQIEYLVPLVLLELIFKEHYLDLLRLDRSVGLRTRNVTVL